MNVHLTFDVEVWCNGWDNLDGNFPSNYDRYVYGRSVRGDYALPKTLEILNRHSLHGVFFVEPLFSARFGQRFLDRIVALIRSAGQEVQLHLHPEWTDEIDPPILKAERVKRQHLTHYNLEEQVTLISIARSLLETAGGGAVTAFRSGSFAANRITFEALQANGIYIDSSLNRCYDISGDDLRAEYSFDEPFRYGELAVYPVTVFRDGFGKLRPAHVTACSFEELSEALLSAKSADAADFVIVSHGFELLRPNSTTPDPIVVARFEKLCEFLSGQRHDSPVTGFPTTLPAAGRRPARLATVSRRATMKRHAEQALRRMAQAVTSQS